MITVEPSSSREQVQRQIVGWLEERGSRWTAPYGIITGQHSKYRSVGFGIARRLDAVVDIYSPKWILLTTYCTCYDRWVEAEKDKGDDPLDEFRQDGGDK